MFSPETCAGVRRISLNLRSPRTLLLPLALLAGTRPFSYAQAPPPPPPPAPPAAADLPPAPLPTQEAIQRSAAITDFEKRLPDHIKVELASGTALSLSLDDAVSGALQHNLAIINSRENERRVSGLRLTVANALLPSVTAQAYTRTQEINLAAMGFKPQSLMGLLPPGTAFNSIVKVDTTAAQLNVSQQLFNVPAYFLYRASQSASAVANWNTLNTRGTVAFQTASAYLKILADAAEIATARNLIVADQADLSNASQRHAAGVGVRLDVLRAQVQLQNEQQALISAENTYSKDKIVLNRLVGLPAGQELLLTDTVPYSELAALNMPDTMALAFTKRKDYLGLLAQMEVAQKTAKAVRYERLPTIAFGGYYGVLGETTGLYHGVFTATGSVNVPIFKEAQFRGEEQVADAQALGLRRQIDSLRVTIEQQIRANMLDVDSSSQLVAVDRSNVELSREVLRDAQDRFAAGVQDNLPVTDAQAALASAESRLTEDLYQFNVAKLQLARSVGVVESQYRTYLGR